jgi:serine/threonine-protein kinase HipA
MATEQLSVIRDRTIIASLERLSPDDLRLAYEPAIVERAAGEPVISTSLLVRSEPYRRDALLPFFDGLLPEDATRLRLARRLRLDVNDVFGFLREIGRDCAGALSVVPAGMDLSAEERDEVEWLDDRALAITIAELGERPLADEPRENIRISLAGVQDKMAVVLEGERIGLPRGLTPSTHILKPSSREQQRGRLRYPALVPNETFCVELARRSGLTAPAVAIRFVDGEAFLLIERYDRVRHDGRVTRLHQEDFCQALGVRSLQKYEADGGPGIDRYVELLRRWSANVASDVDELIDRIGFNYLIGNADGHAKNFSLLYATDGIRLAPAYDLVSTSVYPSLNQEMATAINGMHDARALQAVHWWKWFAALDLSAERYAVRLGALADRVQAALPTTLEWSRRERFHDALLDEIAVGIAQRGQTLGTIRDFRPAKTR